MNLLEFHLKKHYDALRRWFLFQAAIQGHPLGRMGFGNGDTLMESSNIHDSLRNFHSQYYVATAMTLGFEVCHYFCKLNYRNFGRESVIVNSIYS